MRVVSYSERNGSGLHMESSLANLLTAKSHWACIYVNLRIRGERTRPHKSFVGKKSNIQVSYRVCGKTR